MKTWTGMYELNGQQLTKTVAADNLFDAMSAFSALVPEGATYGGISLDQTADDILTAAQAKLVNLGLTPEEAAAVVGTSTDTP